MREIPEIFIRVCRTQAFALLVKIKHVLTCYELSCRWQVPSILSVTSHNSDTVYAVGKIIFQRYITWYL